MVALVVSERLSVEELRDAARWEHRGKVRARLLAMARLREGGERSATARQFGMSRNVLRIWVGRYNATGIAGLVDRHGGGAMRLSPTASSTSAPWPNASLGYATAMAACTGCCARSAAPG